jgi:adenylate cyclase
MTRRLAAIMFTDLVGFTRLGQQDEEAALRLRREHQTLLRPLFRSYGGREVKTLGDGFLVEFASAVDSVRCAVEIQRRLAQRNALAASADRIVLRIGIHAGDVVEEDGDIVGDAVNVASRIEPLAEPGGISVSATVYEQVRNKLPLQLERMGPRKLKNVEEAVEIYRVALGDARALPRSSVGRTEPNLRLAVLPLANLSADAADGFFADGLTDELISRTAQVPGLRVIARTSVQQYKGSRKPIREIGQELDVGVALEGSVRKAGNRVRITVQLVDTRSEAPLWSMRYDRPFDDIFTIQDDIAGQVASSIAAHVCGPTAEEGPPVVHVQRDTLDMEAYSLFLHARQLLGEKGSEEGIRMALSLFESAVARDPKFARARVGIAETLLWLASDGSVPYHDAERRADAELHRALELNETVAEAHSALAGLYVGLDRSAEADQEARRAIELNPSLADPYRWLAQLAAGAGRIDETVRLLEVARQLNPEDVNVLAFLGRALAYAGREADALTLWEETKPRVRYRVNAHLTEFYLGKGEVAKAETTVRELERLRPNSPWTLTYRGMLAARQGDADATRRAIERLRQKALGGEMTVLFVGFLHHALGESDAFVECMEEALQHHSLPALELMYSPLYAESRKDPRVQDILRRQRESRPSLPGEGLAENNAQPGPDRGPRGG